MGPSDYKPEIEIVKLLDDGEQWKITSSNDPEFVTIELTGEIGFSEVGIRSVAQVTLSSATLHEFIGALRVVGSLAFGDGGE